MNSNLSVALVCGVLCVSGCERKPVLQQEPPPPRSQGEVKSVTLEELAKIVRDRRAAARLQQAEEWPTRGAVYQPVPPSGYVPVGDYKNLNGTVAGLAQEYALLTQCEVMVSMSVAMRPLRVVPQSSIRDAKLAAFDSALRGAAVVVHRVGNSTLILTSH